MSVLKEEINRNIIWFDKSGEKWTEALPLGNGRIGAMVYGDTLIERIQLSEITCWSGEASVKNNAERGENFIPAIRYALFCEDYKKAHELAEGIIGNKLNYGTNLPLGNLWIKFNSEMSNYSNYKRELDIEEAIARVTFMQGDTKYKREIFVSNPDQVLVIRLTAEKLGKICFTLMIDGGENFFDIEHDGKDEILLYGKAREQIHIDGKSGVDFHGRINVKAHGGCVEAEGSSINVEGADSCTIFITLGTSFGGKKAEEECLKQMRVACNKAYDDLKSAHIKDYRRLYGKVEFQLNNKKNIDLPTDIRLENFRKGLDDQGLVTLMFQYGRYLLISSSRENSPLPANLQGVWNDGLACSMGWTCDMHLDINTQMNYWPSEVTNLSECSQPLFHWIKNVLVPSGRVTAKETYGLKGWVAHVFSNAWGYTAPGWSTHWGIHVTGGVWIALHLWEHYLFTCNIDFLRETAYPILKEAAEFFIGYLVEDPSTGYLVTGPSCSPENQFKIENEDYSLSMGNTCDIAFVRELFNVCIMSTQILSVDAELAYKFKEVLDRLPPYKVGSWGQLQEWMMDYEEAVPNHRHTSHILSLYPLSQITEAKVPELAKAAKISLESRLTSEKGWEDTGWSRSLQILYAARLHDGYSAYTSIHTMIRMLTAPNLMVLHPPEVADVDTWVYELDGNTGLTAGIAEMLIQSHDGIIRLLPALPGLWSNGFVKGLTARGGFELDIYWEDGKLLKADIRSIIGGHCCIEYKGKIIDLDVEIGKDLVFLPM